MPRTKKKVKAGRISLRGIAEILGIFGVIGSRVFVALEIRQNADAVRSATIRAFPVTISDAWSFERPETEKTAVRVI
jgi:hypothetical protein